MLGHLARLLFPIVGTFGFVYVTSFVIKALATGHMPGHGVGYSKKDRPIVYWLAVLYWSLCSISCGTGALATAILYLRWIDPKYSY